MGCVQTVVIFWGQMCFRTVLYFADMRNESSQARSNGALAIAVGFVAPIANKEFILFFFGVQRTPY